MDVSSFMPVEGNTLFEFKGGPLDKQGIQIDMDIAPETIVADGHRYERLVMTFEESVANAEDYQNDSRETWVTEYRYVKRVTDGI